MASPQGRPESGTMTSTPSSSIPTRLISQSPEKGQVTPREACPIRSPPASMRPIPVKVTQMDKPSGRLFPLDTGEPSRKLILFAVEMIKPAIMTRPPITNTVSPVYQAAFLDDDAGRIEWMSALLRTYDSPLWVIRTRLSRSSRSTKPLYRYRASPVFTTKRYGRLRYKRKVRPCPACRKIHPSKSPISGFIKSGIS